MRIPASKLGLKKPEAEKSSGTDLSGLVHDAKATLAGVKEAAGGVESLARAIASLEARLSSIEKEVAELSKPRSFVVEHERDSRGFLTASRFQQVVRKNLN